MARTHLSPRSTVTARRHGTKEVKISGMCVRQAVPAFLRNGALEGIGQQALGGEPDPGGNPVAGDGGQHLSRHVGGRDDTGWALHQNDHVTVAVSFGDRHGQPGLGTHIAFAHRTADGRQPELAALADMAAWGRPSGRHEPMTAKARRSR
jgi:hypothetical protein